MCMRSITKDFKTWLAQTHSIRFELQRHFFLRFFDLEFLSQPAEWKPLILGTVPVLGPLSQLWAQSFFHKYLYLNSLDDPRPYNRAVAADVLFIVVVAMLVVGVLTTMQWPSLFPSLQDYLALASLPIKTRDIFVAHFSAVLMLALVFTNVMVSSPSVAMPIVMAGRHGSAIYRHVPGIYIAGSLAGWFTFFLLVTMQGVLLNLIPRRRFASVSLAIQSVLILVLFCLTPWVLRIPELQDQMGLRPGWALFVPPLWFLGVDQFVAGNHDPFVRMLAVRAVLGTVGACITALATYIWSYGRHRTRIIEGPSGDGAESCSRFQAALDRLLRVPQEQAVFGFVSKTFVRSRNHRFVAATFLALAFAIFSESVASRADIRSAVITAPLALSLFLLCGYRYVARLPFELRANWIFRLLLNSNERELQTGVAKLFLYYGIVPVGAISLLIEIPTLGLKAGCLAATACTFAALILNECVLRLNETIPFTSAYLPGRRTPLQTLIAYAAGVGIYVWAFGALIEWTLASNLRSGILILGLAVAWWIIRRRRQQIRDHRRILFEELPDPAIRTLSIT
jgi:hypothetical protein